MISSSGYPKVSVLGKRQMKRHALISVIVLHYRQVNYIKPCLDSLIAQTYEPLELIFVDNHSGNLPGSDLQARYLQVQFIFHQDNLFFSKAFNAAIKQAKGEYIMPLNVDVVLARSFIEKMAAAIQINAQVGMVSGKLLQADADLVPLNPPLIDSTGMYLTPAMRHFDRGSMEKDTGQYEKPAFIFGPSGAAPLYRRSMLDDIAFRGEYFDEDFVIYREDADLAWRAQLRGWKGVYTPQAIAYHVRRVRQTSQRRQIPAVLNMHSVKNRFLLRLKNLCLRNTCRFLLPFLFRDILVVGYIFTFERYSIKAFALVIKLLPRTLRKRKHIMKTKKVSSRSIAAWISWRPVSYPLRESELKEK